MNADLAERIAEGWRGGGGLVARGPRSLLTCAPASSDEVRLRTGARPRERVWRLEVGGRFVRSGGVIYPGGVPFPDELQRQTAVIANEVWLYVDEDCDILGMYWWPDALRRPIASTPRDEHAPGDVFSPHDCDGVFDMTVLGPTETWAPLAVARVSSLQALVFCGRPALAEPLHEMLQLELGGLTLAVVGEEPEPDIDALLPPQQPPFREVTVGPHRAIGREPGRALGPQTWPWPAELLWWADGSALLLKGFEPLSTLQRVAASLAPLAALSGR